MRRLEGQVALITGGAGGLGLAVAERFVAEGARWVLFDRNAARLEQAAAALGDAAACVEGDVRDADANASAVALAVERFGRLDCLVANAGLWDFNRSLLSMTADELAAGYEELLGVNVLGYLHAARAAAPLLVESGGSMVFTLSNAAHLSNGGGILYTASKHAGVGIVRQLAYELAPRVRVNAVAPGAILTGLTGPRSLGLDSMEIGSLGFEAVADRIVPLGFIPSVADYAAAYVFLAARAENVPATGMILNYDGGLAIRGFLTPNGMEAA